MITDVKSPAEPLRTAREQKSPVGTEQSNKGSSRQHLVSQFVVQSAITGAEKVGLFSSQKIWYLEEVFQAGATWQVIQYDKEALKYSFLENVVLHELHTFAM